MTLENNDGTAADEKLRSEIEEELGPSTKEALPDLEGDDEVDDTAGGEAAANVGNGDGAGDGDAPDDPELLDAVANGGAGMMIPKARFDEATGALKDDIRNLTAKYETLEAQRAAALAPLGDPKDWSGERKKLRDQLGAGEIDDDEYQDRRDALVREEAEYSALSKLAMAQQEAQKTAAEQAWVGKFNAWSGKNADFMGNGIRSQMAIDLINLLSQQPDLSDDEVFARAEKELFEAFNWTGKEGAPAAPAPAAAPTNPHARRDAIDAKAQAAASAAPRMAEGGVGERGRNAELDYKDVSYEQWKKLSPEKQKELLGE